MLQFIVLAVAHPRRPPRSGNVQTCRHSNVSTSLRPNSHGINIFANPHPLPPVASIFYKNIGGKGASAFQSPISYPPSPCPPNPFKMNTCKSVSKQSTLTLFRINTYEKQGKRALFAQFWCNVSPFRINTCKSVSKQRTLTTFRMNTYEKQGGGGVILLTRNQMKGFYPQRQSGVNYPSSHPRKGLYKQGSKGNDQYAIGPTSFSTSAVSTMTMASHGQPSRNHPSGPLLRHFLHPIQIMGSIWMRPNRGLSSSGTQNMQSSTGQYSTQAGDPAQPVQHSVITASSFGFFLRAVAIPFERGSCFSSSGTIPGALTTSGALAISWDSTLNIKHFSVWFLLPVLRLLQCRCNPIHLRSHTCSPSHSSNILRLLCSPDSGCASSSSGIFPSIPGIRPITKSLPGTGCTTVF